MKSTNAVRRSADVGASGSHAMSGVTAMRPAVTAFGRFTCERTGSGERLEHQLADCAQRLEHSIAGDGDCFKIRRALDQFSGRQLLDQILPCMIDIGCDALTARLGKLPPRVQRTLQLA